MDYIKIVVSETGCEDVEWIQVLQSTVLIAAPQIILDWQEICNFNLIFTWNSLIPRKVFVRSKTLIDGGLALIPFWNVLVKIKSYTFYFL
jgi:hypothetical protein